MFAVPEVGNNLRIAIQQARTAKGWTQKELAQKLNEPAQVINQCVLGLNFSRVVLAHVVVIRYEAGTCIPNNQMIAKFEKILGAKLPRPKKV